MRQRFVTSQWIPYPVDLAFAFFANPHNLPLLMPEALRMRIDKLDLRPAPPNPMIAASQVAKHETAAGAGTSMEISFRPLSFLPVRVKWVAQITEFVWFSHFCDEQVRGPFEYFRHRHGIRSQIQNGQAGTELTDDVEFSVPLGTMGQLGNKVVERQMRKMFRMRQERLPLLLEAKVRQTS